MAKLPNELIASLFQIEDGLSPMQEGLSQNESLHAAAPALHDKLEVPDAAERSRALDPAKSFLVQAPAGSGKTELLTKRFLRLLGQAHELDEIVAITFTNAAAAEMRHRVLDELERVGLEPEDTALIDPQSLRGLAHRAMAHAGQMGWQLLDQPGQLRITTIDAFCRSLALQSPLNWGQLSGLGGRLEPSANPRELYRTAASGLMQRLLEDATAIETPTRKAIEALLLLRDNNWRDVEDLIVQMLGARNRWYQDFVFDSEPDWIALRKRLEAPFCRAARMKLEKLAALLDLPKDGRERMTDLARFACENGGKNSPIAFKDSQHLLHSLTARAEFKELTLLDDAVEAHRTLATFLLTKGAWRKRGGLNVNYGFPNTDEGNDAKDEFARLVADLDEIEGLRTALADVQTPHPTRYTEEEWTLVQHCFRVLRAAAGELKVVFAQTGSVDFTEVAQIALNILAPVDGYPSDFAIRQADTIRHLLVDEFQDTSRSQHRLLSSLILAWPEREGRSCFCVGDPMQSIYSFREAEVELFERLKTHGLEMPYLAHGEADEPLRFELITLRANFRTTPTLVDDLNGHFAQIFGEEDGSGVSFSSSEAAREPAPGTTDNSAKTELHLAFTARKCTPDETDPILTAGQSELTRKNQLAEIVNLVRDKLETMQAVKGRSSHSSGSKAEQYRIAVLARTKKSLILIADALRRAKIPYRAIEIVPLADRPEVLDALSLARALLNPVDRTAWLGVLRAPWCGLTLEDLHLLTSADDSAITNTAVPVLLRSRLDVLFADGRMGASAFEAASRVSRVLRTAAESRALASTLALGTWLESVWKQLGGDDTVNAEQRANVSLLWAALDKLPGGELDLLGPSLPAALSELCALPDPNANSDFGVQLMTIHKSKGLEFEVVIVPDLEAEGQKYDKSMISWLERGLVDRDEAQTDDLTEFLIAPIQPKGQNAGIAKKWVDGVKKERERQELRRVFYVASTRAREELHLFARPRYSLSKTADGIGPVLTKPTGLLDIARPAFNGEVEDRFQTWLASLPASMQLSETSTEPKLVATIAAAANETGGKLLKMPGRPTALHNLRPTPMRRLPDNYVAPYGKPRNSVSSPVQPENAIKQPLYGRTAGGLESRLEGVALHALLEQLSHLRLTMDSAEASLQLAASLPPVVASVRSHGLTLEAAQKLASEALAVAIKSAVHPVGSWIFAPHANGKTEVQWSGVFSGEMRNLRPDRVFFAASPLFVERNQSSALDDGGEDSWWIIDYKSARGDGPVLPGSGLSDPKLDNEADQRKFLLSHRDRYAGQLAIYAQVLRAQFASRPPGVQSEPQNVLIRAGLYYPQLALFDFWKT